MQPWPTLLPQKERCRCHPGEPNECTHWGALNLVGLGPEPWRGGSVAPGDSAADSDDSAVNSGTNGVVDLAVELWKSVSVDDGGLLEISKSGGVHNVSHNVSKKNEEEEHKRQ